MAGENWTDVVDTQTPNWSGVNDGQSPSWSNVGDSQNPNWRQVIGYLLLESGVRNYLLQEDNSRILLE